MCLRFRVPGALLAPGIRGDLKLALFLYGKFGKPGRNELDPTTLRTGMPNDPPAQSQKFAHVVIPLFAGPFAHWISTQLFQKPGHLGAGHLLQNPLPDLAYEMPGVN